MGDLERRLGAVLDAGVLGLTPVRSQGFTTAYHALAELDDERTVFLKVGTEEVTSGFLQQEIEVYQVVEAPFMPAFLGADTGDPPFLVLEDLSG